MLQPISCFSISLDLSEGRRRPAWATNPSREEKKAVLFGEKRRGNSELWREKSRLWVWLFLEIKFTGNWMSHLQKEWGKNTQRWKKPEASESSVTFSGAHLKRPSSTDGYWPIQKKMKRYLPTSRLLFKNLVSLISHLDDSTGRNRLP